MKTNIWQEDVIISPSLITLDLCNLEEQVRILEDAGVSMLHIDILDGHFSPSMPLGLDTVRQLRQLTDLPFDVHLMATENDFFIEELLDIGVQQLLFHVETEQHIDRQLSRVRAHGVRCGLALKPATPLGVLKYVLASCDTVLLMLINPGYAGHKTEGQVPYAEQKISDLRSMIRHQGLTTKVEIDGRVSREDIEKYARHSVDIFVAGSTCLKRDRLETSATDLLAFCQTL
jgi:ribulose-phosphate 3-epimerase